MKSALNILLLLLFTQQVLSAINVELSVKECAGVGATAYPITTVVPLPAGGYQDISHFRVTDAGGATVPAQFNVLNRNVMKDNSIANLMIVFQPTVTAYTGSGTGIVKYYLKDDGTGNATGTGLTVTDGSNTISVVTGPLKFIVSKTAFNIIDQLWLDKNQDGSFDGTEQLILSGNHNGGVFKGRLTGDIQYDASRSDVDVVIEENGPMRTVIRAEALTKYYGTTNHTHGWAVRIYAFAGKPYVKIDYQLQNSAKNKVVAWPLYFESMNLDFPLNLSGVPSIRVGLENGQTYQRTLGKGLYLAQEKYDTYKVRDLATNDSVSMGAKTAGYLDVSNGSYGVAAMTRFFWQMWPNGLAMDSTNKLQIQLFPEWSKQWWGNGSPVFSVTGLYWLEDMQHVYKEMLLVFHDGAMTSTQLNGLAKTLTYPPVATLSTSWYAQTRTTLDLGGMIPYDQKNTTVDSARVPNLTDMSQSNWDRFTIVDGRRVEVATAGGWPAGQGGVTVSENPVDYYLAERNALGEINIRPNSMAGYTYLGDWNFLHLGVNASDGSSYTSRKRLAFQSPSYRRQILGAQQLDTAYLTGTALDAYPRDDQHLWYYHVEDAFFITGNPWIKDWYRFLGEYLKWDVACSTGTCGTQFMRDICHDGANAMSAFRVTGDTVGLKMMGYFFAKRIGGSVDRLLGEGPGSGYGANFKPWMAGFGYRGMVNYLESIKGNQKYWQNFVEVYQVLSSQMEYNCKYGNYANEIIGGANPNPSYEGAVTMVDPAVWYYLHSGKKKYLDHLNTYINQGINGGSKPASGIILDWSNWSGQWEGRLIEYLRSHPKTDTLPPSAIQDLKLSKSGNQCTLSWTAPADAKRYMIVWSDRFIADEQTADETQVNWWAPWHPLNPWLSDSTHARVIGPEFLATPGLIQSITFTAPDTGQVCAAIFSFDSAYNLSVMSNRVFSDTTAPAQPQHLQALLTDGHTVSLTWDVAQDPESGIRGYKISKNNSLVSTQQSIGFIEGDLPENTSFTYVVTGLSGIFRESAPCSISVKTPVDTVKPKIISARSISERPEITLLFNEVMNEASVENIANYSLNLGRTIVSVVLQADKKTVIVTCDSLTPGASYQLTLNNVKDIAAAGNLIEANTIASFTAMLPFKITNTNTPAGWTWDVVAVGKLPYIDATYAALTKIPAKYLGCPYLRVSNSNYTITRNLDSMYTFNINKEAMVYVAYDDNQYNTNHRPTWLVDNYKDNGDNIDGFSLWEKKFSPGMVKLGGCKGDAAYGMYFVVVKPLDSSIVVKAESVLPDLFLEGMSAFPNPFNPQVQIVVQSLIPDENSVIVKDKWKASIFDLTGRKVADITPEKRILAGNRLRLEYSWNAAHKASGVYFVSVQTGNKSWRKRVLLVR